LTICRYALDVNTERAEDVLTHKNLLHIAEIPENRPAFNVRAVHVSFKKSMKEVLGLLFCSLKVMLFCINSLDLAAYLDFH
jgi:hypothetical protein